MELNGTYIPSKLDWVRDQIDLYERTNGSEGNTHRDTGLPVVIVTMLGAKTHSVRKIALMKVEHDGEYGFVASFGGRPTNPDWYNNLTANPDSVLLQDGPTPFAVSVREVFGEERAMWWDRSVAAFSTYADYQEKTERIIPVLVAKPVA
jgi:F420H(2)-dependent quinone reductase